nr:MAG TPA: hypothetical protein [Caudoviricetes sp.]
MRHRRTAWDGRCSPPHRTRTGMRLRMPAMRANPRRTPCDRRRPHHVQLPD